MSLTSCTPLALFLLASLVPAQSPPAGGYSVYGGPIPWPDALPAPSVFHDASLGSFYDGASVDGAVLVDARAYLIYDVWFQATFGDKTPENEVISAMASVVPEAPWERWGLAMAGNAGVWLHVEPPPGSEEPASTVLIATGAPWNALSHLRAAKLDNAGSTDLIGGTASSIHLLHHNGSGWVSGASIPVSGTVLDVLEIDWNGDGDEEAAALTTNGLSVFEVNGQLLDFFIGPASWGRIAPIPVMEGYATGRLAWAFPVGPKGRLIECLPGGSRNDCGEFPAATAAIASGIFVDPSDNRRVDLVTTAATDDYLRYFLHQAPGGDPYDAASPAVVNTEAFSPYGACRISMRDITGDHIPDVLFGRPGGGGQVFFASGAEPTFAGMGYPKTSLWPFIDPRMVLEESEAWFQVHLDTDLPAGSPAYNHLQVRVWRSADGDLLDHVEYANLQFELAAPAYAANPELEDADMRIAVQIPGTFSNSCSVLSWPKGYYFTMRLVQLDPVDGHLIAWSPPVSAGVTCSDAIATKMDEDSDGWLDLQFSGCPGPADAPCLVKSPLWARGDPYTPPEFQPLNPNPPVPSGFQ